jgi:hypothetical protein
MGRRWPVSELHQPLERMEERSAPSAGLSYGKDAALPRHPTTHLPLAYVAHLSGANVVSSSSGPVTTVSTPGAGKLTFMVTPDGKTTTVTGNTSSVSTTTVMMTKTGVVTPASGTVSFQVSPDGRGIKVVGTLSRITNVSAVDLHMAATGSNGPTVDVLLSPGNGSGPLPHGPFRTVIKAPYLTGPLTGQRLSSLVRAMDAGMIYVQVQTSNGVDPSSGPSFPGNYPNGELRGQVVAK